MAWIYIVLFKVPKTVHMKHQSDKGMQLYIFDSNKTEIHTLKLGKKHPTFVSVGRDTLLPFLNIHTLNNLAAFF